MGQLPGDLHLKISAPVRDCSSYRGNLLSTVQPVGKQGHHDASHDLRGSVQQELLHVDNLLYRRAVPGAFLAGPCSGCKVSCFGPPAHAKRAENRRMTPDFGPLSVSGGVIIVQGVGIIGEMLGLID